MGGQPELDELVEHFTLLPDDVALLRNKSGATRLGFALILKHFIMAGRFPTGRAELASETVDFVAKQVGVPAADLGFYDWTGRQIKAHRAETRRALGFRECRSMTPTSSPTGWWRRSPRRSGARSTSVRRYWSGAARCAHRSTQPGSGGPDGGRRAAPRRGRAARPGRQPVTRRRRDRIRALVAGNDSDGDPGGGDRSVLVLIKADPGNVSLESMLTEIDKLLAVRAV